MIERYYFYNIRVTRSDGYYYVFGICSIKSWFRWPAGDVYETVTRNAKDSFSASGLKGKFEVVSLNRI